MKSGGTATRSAACAMKIKIKFRGDRFTQWYRAFRDDVPIGWQAQRPDDYVDVPYFSATLNPFDPELQHELQHDEILWPEGEKDVQSLSKLGLPAFTFGGIGDGTVAVCSCTPRSTLDRHRKDSHFAWSNASSGIA